jgi:eukaryotic-like serine/threonine-protein kinase
MTRYQAGDQLDRYQIVELLGAGAYAESYKAVDTRNGDTVVLKIANPTLFADPANFNRYRREAEVARRLNHPSVQHAVDAGESRTEPYLVLTYVEGMPLRKRLRTFSGPVPINTVIDWGRQLVDALVYLHDQGVVHRDLKPENLLVTPNDRLVIADFGTAQLAGARRLTWRHLSESLGTPDYMSPEQVQGERGDARSDIYAWGVLMYEMLTGRVPFEGDNWMAVMAGHLQGIPMPIHKLRPDVPPVLENVVLHAMRRYPDHRYASAKELRDDLDRLDSLDPNSYDTAPEPPMGGMAAASSTRRLWALTAMIAVGFIGVVTVIIVLSILLR